MTISYPLELPSHQFTSFALTPECSGALLKSEFNYSQQMQDYGGQAWIADVTVRDLEEDTAREWVAFAASLTGSLGTFMLGDPIMSTPRGNVGLDTILVDGGGQTGQTINLKQFSPLAEDALRKGDYLQIGLNLYVVLKDVSADFAGKLTADIFPKLRSSYADNTPIITSGPKGMFRAVAPIQWSCNEEKTYFFSFQAIEVL